MIDNNDMHVVERLQSLQWRKGLFLYDQLTPCLVRDVREEGSDLALALGLGTAVQTSWAAQCKQLAVHIFKLLTVPDHQLVAHLSTSYHIFRSCGTY